jgi:hypothetical protein
MRTILVGCLVAAALVGAEAASAGCWATVGLAPPPAATAPGDVWVAKITVLQHGERPLPNAAEARPTLTITNLDTRESRRFTAVPSDLSTGAYEARVVFPAAGSWRYEVFDGFVSSEEGWSCAQTHTFAAVPIGGTTAVAGPPSPVPDGFPAWQIVLGGLLGLAMLAAAAVGGRRLRVARQG